MKVLIIDDSALFRILLTNIIRGMENVEVCGTASDGDAGLQAVEKHHPDVVLLDLEMPKMTGLDVMKEISSRGISVKVIMCSAFTTAGAEVTVKALELGAHDFITKPEGRDKEESIQLLKKQLLPELEELKKSFSKNKSASGIAHRKRFSVRTIRKIPAEIIGIGISTGGPKALGVVLPKLPVNLKQPIVIVQHMPKLFIESMATSLNNKCHLLVKVGEDGEVLRPGTVYFAPGEQQMAVDEEDGIRKLRISDDSSENYCKPASDYLFRSLARVYGSKAIGLVMTGMGGDGAKGLVHMKDAGAYTMSQDKDSCTIYGMPKEAVKAGAVMTVLSLDEIADHLVKITF